MQESHRLCVFVCVVCMLIISEHDVLGLNYSTHSHVTLTEGILIGGIKTHNNVHNSPRCKETSADCQGQCHWNSQQMGLSIFTPDASACWSHSRLVAGYALFVCLFVSMRWYQNLLTKRVVGLERDITILGFIYRKLDGVHCKCANDVST